MGIKLQPRFYVIITVIVALVAGFSFKDSIVGLFNKKSEISSPAQTWTHVEQNSTVAPIAKKSATAPTPQTVKPEPTEVIEPIAPQHKKQVEKRVVEKHKEERAESHKKNVESKPVEKTPVKHKEEVVAPKASSHQPVEDDERPAIYGR